MYPSKLFRSIVSKEHNIKLNNYAWDKELQKQVFSQKVESGKKLLSLKTVFVNGYNIGNCLYTAYNVAKLFPNASVVNGKVSFLVGSKNCPKGDHVWIETEDEIIDTTLMIRFSKFSELAKFYERESELSGILPDSELSYEYAIFERKSNIISYYNSLYAIAKKK